MGINKSSSVLKRERQTVSRTLRNKGVRTEIKTYIRRVNESLVKGDREAAKKEMAVLFSRLDKAVKKGVIHRNNASNHKSKLARKLNALSSEKKT